ncbi:MAG: class I SAM-dependent methyltransferase [Bacillota bacterium]
MSYSLDCPLCGAIADYFSTFREISYYRCNYCKSVFMDPADHLNFEDEKLRYDQHNNDVNDAGYRKFAKPIVDKIKEDYDHDHAGLDYGAGPGPVAAVLLEEEGFRKIERYDPFYWPDKKALQKKYDFIICCEVIEHLRFPSENFSLLRSLLLPGGSLYCMTVLYDDSLDFEQWYYKNDPTHVFFYHRKALEWIKEKYNFNKLNVINRLICLKS